MRILFLISAIVLSLGSGVENTQLDEKDTNSMIKANYLYNFAKLVGWPEKKSKGNFVIGILGDPSLYQQMIKRYSDKSIGNQPIEIVQLLGTDRLTEMHMLFVSRTKSGETEAVVKETMKANTMVVTESDSGLSHGSVINIVVVDNRLKFDINETNAGSRELVIANTLKSLANNLIK